jgi:hypothetical protein
MQRDLLGVTATSPGAAAIDVRTPNGGITSAAGTVPTQRGPVQVSWRRDGERFDLALIVPANVFATVHVPTAQLDHVFDGSTNVDGADGVVAARVVHGEVVVTLGGGHYALHVGTPRAHRSFTSLAVAIALTLLLLLVLAVVVVGAIRYRRGVRAPTPSSP